jgi:hypothetical protein
MASGAKGWRSPSGRAATGKCPAFSTSPAQAPSVTVAKVLNVAKSRSVGGFMRNVVANFDNEWEMTSVDVERARQHPRPVVTPAGGTPRRRPE